MMRHQSEQFIHKAAGTEEQKAGYYKKKGRLRREKTIPYMEGTQYFRWRKSRAFQRDWWQVSSVSEQVNQRLEEGISSRLRDI